MSAGTRTRTESPCSRGRYLLHPDAVEAARARTHRSHIPRCVLSLLERGLVDELRAGAEVVPGVSALSLPGHDPGHMGVRIGHKAVLIGDAVTHPALLDEPDWLFETDHDHERAAETRRALVAELVDTDTLVVCGHYPGSGIGRVTRRDGRVVWETHTPHPGWG